MLRLIVSSLVAIVIAVLAVLVLAGALGKVSDALAALPQINSAPHTGYILDPRK